MNYYDEIDPLGEEKQNECYYCGRPCDGDYCSESCKDADLKENCYDDWLWD